MRHNLVFAIGLLFLSAFFMSLGEAHVSLASHSYQVVTSTVTIGSTTSTSLSLQQPVFNSSFTVLSTTATNLQCEFWTYNFTANTGEYIFGNFTADNPVSFFVVQTPTYQSWLKAGTCGNLGAAIAGQLITTSYSFSRAVPTSGMWTIVIVNSSNAKNADGWLVAYLSSGSSTVTQPFMGTITTTISSSSVLAPSTNGQLTGIDGFPVASIAIGIIVGLIAIAALRRRNRS